MIDCPFPPDSAVAEKIREFCADAVAAGYDDPLWGALVIASMVVVGLERELPTGRHPNGKASGGV